MDWSFGTRHLLTQLNTIVRVERQLIKSHVTQALKRYWSENQQLIEKLPVNELPLPRVTRTPDLTKVQLPEWGAEVGVNGQLLVPREACENRGAPDWSRVDWWLAAFILMECWHERKYENENRPIHSYSFKLGGWNSELWERAWVNRIALFLRRWASFGTSLHHGELFGPVPRAEILLTHDVDAIEKTWSIRIKQSAFGLFNSFRLLSRSSYKEAGSQLKKSFGFFNSQHDWWTFDRIQEMEKQAGLRSQFNFYADLRKKSLQRWLFDPGYDLSSPALANKIRELYENGWKVGLHQAYDSWCDQDLMKSQLDELTKVCQGDVTSCRQHWLRFSWRDTWRAQSACGLREDTTLMFNDRPGFRASAAIAWNPWDHESNRQHNLRCLPTILMDSHLYDYQSMNSQERLKKIAHWIGEVESVGGQAAVLWHPHTISDDYGWLDGLEYLVSRLKELEE